MEVIISTTRIQGLSHLFPVLTTKALLVSSRLRMTLSSTFVNCTNDEEGLSVPMEQVLKNIIILVYAYRLKVIDQYGSSRHSIY